MLRFGIGAQKKGPEGFAFRALFLCIDAETRHNLHQLFYQGTQKSPLKAQNERSQH